MVQSHCTNCLFFNVFFRIDFILQLVVITVCLKAGLELDTWNWVSRMNSISHLVSAMGRCSVSYGYDSRHPQTLSSGQSGRLGIGKPSKKEAEAGAVSFRILSFYTYKSVWEVSVMLLWCNVHVFLVAALSCSYLGKHRQLVYFPVIVLHPRRGAVHRTSYDWTGNVLVSLALRWS